MRNISFALTKQQILARIKTVTRRVGWRNLRAGETLQGVEKCQGLKKGETVKKLCTIRVVDIRFEPLRRMTSEINYGIEECIKEGFGDHPQLMFPSNFIDHFCESHRNCTPETEVTRIEFEYVEGQ